MFLPSTKEELQKRKIPSLDIILITGDAYIDSPFSGAAVIGRYLESLGFTVGIIAQPDMENPADIARLGEPELFWGVTSGCVDSMVANYTALRKKRKGDDYTPGGLNNRRPDRASLVYTNLIRRYFKNTRPIVLGGIEASLRRVALLREGQEERGLAGRINRGFDWLKRNYARQLGTVLQNRRAIYVAWGVVSVLAVLMFTQAPKELAPTEDQGVIFGVLNTPSNSTSTADPISEVPEKGITPSGAVVATKARRPATSFSGVGNRSVTTTRASPRERWRCAMRWDPFSEPRAGLLAMVTTARSARKSRYGPR